MFEQYVTPIPVSELFKRLVSETPRTLGRRQALDIISAFECAQWQPQLFNGVWSKYVDGGFEFDGTVIIYTGNRLFDDIETLLKTYLREIAPEDHSPNRVYSTREAADYLGVSVRTMKYHIHTGNNLKGKLVGHSLIFTRDELDEFKRTRRGRGRPANPKTTRKASEK